MATTSFDLVSKKNADWRNKRARLNVTRRLGEYNPKLEETISGVTNDPKWTGASTVLDTAEADAKDEADDRAKAIAEFNARVIPTLGEDAPQHVAPAATDKNNSAQNGAISGIAAGRGAAKPSQAFNENYPLRGATFYPAGGDKMPNLQSGSAAITHRDGSVTVNRWDQLNGTNPENGRPEAPSKFAFASEAEANKARWDEKNTPLYVPLPKPGGGDAYDDAAGKKPVSPMDVPATDEAEPVHNPVEEKAEKYTAAELQHFSPNELDAMPAPAREALRSGKVSPEDYRAYLNDEEKKKKKTERGAPKGFGSLTAP